MSSGTLSLLMNWIPIVALHLGVLLVLTMATVSAGPLPLVQVPNRCDVIVIKSVASNAYLGVNQSALKATYDYGDSEARFEFNLLGLPSGPALLTVNVSANGTDRRRLLLGFEGSRGVMKNYAYGNYANNKQPNDTMLMLGGWPVTNVTVSNSTILRAGPYYRLYLRNNVNVSEARGVIGVNRAGQVMLYPLDNGDSPNAPFVNPSTLFLIDVVIRPGASSCTRVTG